MKWYYHHDHRSSHPSFPNNFVGILHGNNFPDKNVSVFQFVARSFVQWFAHQFGGSRRKPHTRTVSILR